MCLLRYRVVKTGILVKHELMDHLGREVKAEPRQDGHKEWSSPIMKAIDTVSHVVIHDLY